MLVKASCTTRKSVSWVSPCETAHAWLLIHTPTPFAEVSSTRKARWIAFTKDVKATLCGLRKPSVGDFPIEADPLTDYVAKC